MSLTPFISVVMPVYNCEAYVEEAIDSILSQSIADFEFIIIDDGSTDNTPEILKTFSYKDSRVKLIQEEHKGLVPSLNKGLSEARGEWIFRMDQDDISLPHRFETQINEIDKDPSLVLLSGWFETIDSKGNFLKTYEISDEDLIPHLLSGKTAIAHPTVCFRRDVVLKLRGYRHRFSNAEDIDLWLRMVGKGGIKCCQRVVLKLRKHGNNISITNRRLQYINSIAAQICYLYRTSGLDDPAELDETKWQLFISWLEHRIEELGDLHQYEQLTRLSNLLNSNNCPSKIRKITALLWELMKNSLVRESLYKKYFSKKINLIELLYEESKQVLNK